MLKVKLIQNAQNRKLSPVDDCNNFISERWWWKDEKIVLNAVTDIVDNTIESKLEKSEKELMGRQNKEKECYNIQSQRTFLFAERTKADKELEKWITKWTLKLQNK